MIVISPVPVGSGQVKCAHGILPVPAPATAHILRDVPIYGGEVRGELCTPTGAALLKHFATRFGDMPVMKTRAIGMKKSRPGTLIRVMCTERDREHIVGLLFKHTTTGVREAVTRRYVLDRSVVGAAINLQLSHPDQLSSKEDG